MKFALLSTLKARTKICHKEWMRYRRLKNQAGPLLTDAKGLEED
jgi:hypothetical protein